MKTTEQIVQEVLLGKWGFGDTRKKKLNDAGYSYIEIQSLVNKKFKLQPVKATITELAQEIIDGKWGLGEERKKRLEAIGYNYLQVQTKVNELLQKPQQSSSEISDALSDNKPLPAPKISDIITAKGVDISYYQGNINFTQLKAGGVQFVILREGYSTKIDNNFITYAQQAKVAQIPIHGIYHFCYATNEAGVINEAQSCLVNLQKAGLDKSTIIFFDFEYDTVDNAKRKGVYLGKKECISFTKTFCDYMEKFGYRAGIYTNLDYCARMYDEETLNKYILWIAAYNNSGKAPRPCAYWQWSGNGRTPGINVVVDLDNCYIINPKL